MVAVTINSKIAPLEIVSPVKKLKSNFCLVCLAMNIFVYIGFFLDFVEKGMSLGS
jgi:hypothetical protein